MKFLIAKLTNSTRYSIQGLVYILKKELSFQLEFIYFLISLIALYFVPIPILEKAIIFLTLILLLVAEIFNTALEIITDQISPEKSIFAQHVKDLGSAAVFLLLLASFVEWGVVLFKLLV